MDYATEISALYDDVYKKLISWKLPDNIINLNKIQRKRTPPTGVRSEFLMNRALGDWAEEKILDAFTAQFPDFLPSKYGNSDNIVAGDPKFKSFFNAYVQELGKVGKRPDILIFERDMNKSLPRDISNFDPEMLQQIIPKAKYGIEVRSSKIKAKKYREFKESHHDTKKSRTELSITPKVEDLPLVVKWINTFQIPHFYFQVCLDEVYGISFRNVLKFILNSNTKGIIEKNPNNAEKATIHIPFSKAIKIGEFVEPAEFDSENYEDDRGRINPYVRPKGGKLVFDVDEVKRCLQDEQET